MPINNVINTNRISELLKGTTVRKTRPSQAPAYLTKFGSIFNAPGVHQPAPIQGSNIAELNTRHSLKDLEDDKKQPKENSKDNNKFEGIDSVSGGKAAVAEGNSIKDTTQKYTRQAENDTKVVKQFDSGAQKLEKQIIKDDKQFAARFKTDQKEFKKDNDKLIKLVKEQEETQKQVDNAQHELDSLLASNSFGASNSIGNSDKSGKINELQQFIGAKVGLMQNNGKVVYSLQRNQTRTLRRLNKTNAQYIKINNINQKNMKTEQTQTNKVIEVANKIEQYSAMAQTAGQAINIAGMGLVALGQATSGFFGAGAALIAVGNVMQKVGKVVELVGQYGQCAAGLTKTAAYAAEGNIMGAMMSAASAMQSGAAAVAGTKGLKGEFGKIDAQANAAKQAGEAKFEAKQIVNEQTKGMSKEEATEALGGMSKKDAQKSIASQIREQKAAGSTNYTAEGLLEGAKKDFGTGDAKTQKNNLKTAVDKRNEATMKKLGATSTDWGAQLQKLGSSATSIAGIFMQSKAIDQMSRNTKRNIQPYQMDARTRMIMERNQRYRRHSAAYV